MNTGTLTATEQAPVAQAEVTQAPSTALLTDQYELTMLQAAIADGVAEHRAVFELFARRLPTGRRYGVVAGLGRFLDALAHFRFTDAQVDKLAARGVVDDATADYLRAYRFSGNIDAYQEGEVYFPHSPVLTIEGTFGECVLLETLALSILNHDSAIASAAARMVHAAGGRTLIEMGSRRTGEQAAVAAARAAYLTGFTATSNLQAGDVYGVPTTGTAAHAFTLAHRDERAAFASQVAALGTATTLLVDTYDIPTGIRTAVEVAGTDLGGVRLDSGDPRVEVPAARELLDALGAVNTRIVVSSDLDEHTIAELAEVPVDGYGVGTRLVTGSGAPTAEMVFKLVAIADEPGLDTALRPVAKRSSSKASVGGRKRARRILDDDGVAVAEHVTTRYLISDVTAAVPTGRALQVPVVRDGVRVHNPSIDDIRAHHRGAMAELTTDDLDLAPGAPRLIGGEQ
ncbi:nicotinate phosphoribosyltransferase [Rhodococcus sp. X156]|uniref:nicotinate phosphoribosyltransferase n=1 Tax=Rhodococcus sp. X156 TaxID=2499145 RepID=UPI000FD9C4AC|nr:nicotinate phosphoribosyltransferase [Rhodococcus sp. X156]